MPRIGTDATDSRQDGHEEVWRSRAVAAAAVRVLAIGGPVALGTLAARLAVDMFHPGSSTWVVSLTALLAATVVSLLTARLGMRLLPLAVLLKMTMVFPDRAPSRVKVARRASSAVELRHSLEHPDADARETATTLLALVTALGRHDRKTRGHSERVRLYCDLIGRQLGLSEADCGRLRWVGLLHDIGKLEVAAAVLNKPTKLDDDEWDLIRAHPHSGARLAQPLASWLGPWFDGIEHHHERYDGRGYPHGLAGEEISVAGRAVSVVDAFETMTAARSYKSPMSTVAARAELTRCAGTHFDPVMVRAFLAIALPRLLWTMGPLTFLVNVPFLRWMPVATERAATLANASVGAASNAVGVTAVSVAIAAAPTQALAHSHAHAAHLEGESASVVQLVDQSGGHSHAHLHTHSQLVAPAPAGSTPAAARSAAPAARAAALPAGTVAPDAAAPGSAAAQDSGDAGPASGQPDVADAPHHAAAPTGEHGKPSPAESPGKSGQADHPTPGQAAKPTLPGQANQPTLPGQANQPTPPGQVNQPTPPGQMNHSTPPGQMNHSTPPGQANEPTPPGQVNKPTPPGQSHSSHGH